MKSMPRLSVARLYKALLGLLSLLASLLILGPLGDWLSRLIVDHPPWVIDLLKTNWPLVLAIVVVMGGLTVWSGIMYNHERLREEFALFESTAALRPEKLNFHVLTRGESPPSEKPLSRPFYPDYIHRMAVPYEHTAQKGPNPEYTEGELVQELEKGKWVLLLGQPLAGKSRTLYEIVKRMEGYHVVSPSTQKRLPVSEAFALLKGRPVVVLIENLNEYAGAAIDLAEFCENVGKHAEKWTVAATCRNGAELGSVRDAVQTTLRPFYEAFPLKLRLLPLTKEEKERLAHSVDHEQWDPEQSALFPTPGFITMREHLEAMRIRFQALRSAQQKDPLYTLRALKLLSSGGILPFTHCRIEAVMKGIFQRHDFYLSDCLDLLVDRAFIQHSPQQGPVEPEPAYLKEVVTYAEGKAPEDDFPALARELEGLDDAPGLFYLGLTHMLPPKGMPVQEYNGQQALACFERALRLKTDFPEAWHHKGVCLSFLGNTQEALSAFDQALHLSPDFYQAWVGKGNALQNLASYQEALQAYDQALRLQPDAPDAWTNKGRVLASLGRYQEALDAYEKVSQSFAFSPAWFNKGTLLVDLNRYSEAVDAYEQGLRIDPHISDAWFEKGKILYAVERYEEALEAYEQALQLEPHAAGAWNNKGIVLDTLGRYEEALEAYDQAISFSSEELDAWLNKAGTLRSLKRYQEALNACDQALRLSPNAEAWAKRGLVLNDLERYQEALEACNQALSLNADNSEAWSGKGEALTRLGHTEEALDAYKQAIRIRPESFESWFNKGALLAILERYPEALDAYEQGLKINPNIPDAWLDKGKMLGALGRQREALRAYEQAINLNREFSPAWFEKGNTLEELQSYQEAVEAYDQVLRLNPGSSDVWQLKSYCLRALGWYQEALEACNQALSLNADAPDVWFLKGLLLNDLGHHNKAGEWLYRAWDAREQLSEEFAEDIAQALRNLGYNP
jgi:tetratricopeptide (TPR) repeat protein